LERKAMKAIQVNVQLYRPELDQIEGWRKAQPGFPSRAAALRNFISLGLKASTDIPAKEQAA
jgi:hypothetical protein